MSLTGVKDQELQDVDKSGEQDTDKTKQDSGNQAIDTSLNTDTKPLESQTDCSSNISSNHKCNDQESNMAELSNSNVSSLLTVKIAKIKTNFQLFFLSLKLTSLHFGKNAYCSVSLSRYQNIYKLMFVILVVHLLCMHLHPSFPSAAPILNFLQR